MTTDGTSHGGTDVVADDGHRVPSDGDAADESRSTSPSTATDGHPMPWRTLDYGATDRIDDLESTAHDSDVPSIIDDAMTPRTGWNPSDTEHGDRYTEWLKKLNDGVGEQDRDIQKHRAGIARDLSTFAAHLGATDRQRDRAQWLLDHVEIKEAVIPDGPIEVAVLAALSLAIDEDRTRSARHLQRSAQHSDDLTVADALEEAPNSVLRDDRFTELCADLDMDVKYVRAARQRLRETDVYESANDSH